MRNMTSTVLYRWFHEVWNKDNEDAIETFMTPDAFPHGILTDDQPRGAEGFKQFFRGFRSQFSNVNIDVEDVICQDDVEVARTTVYATHTETGKKVSFPGLCMARIENGKIAEAWNSYDFLNLYQQIGMQLTPVD
ncbi:ester cyclase [Spirosoma sp. KNUC1025]|uniref:ester cyclase n=1 Tax=Spirosoma sp. KNUC1025 TaxID=2894082 RepID=UPI0038687F1C|nr:ester cyclase [Spirosoma sp. KNUC1025]